MQKKGPTQTFQGRSSSSASTPLQSLSWQPDSTASLPRSMPQSLHRSRHKRSQDSASLQHLQAKRACMPRNRNATKVDSHTRACAGKRPYSSDDVEVAELTQSVNDEPSDHTISKSSTASVTFTLPSESPALLLAGKHPHHVVDVNDLWLQTCGFRRAEVIGKTMQQLIQGPATQQGRVHSLMEAVKLRQPHQTVLTSYTRSGELFKNDVLIEPVGAADGLSSTHFLACSSIVMIVDQPDAVMHRPVNSPCVSPPSDRDAFFGNLVPSAFLSNPNRADELRDEIVFVLRREQEAVTILGRKRAIPDYLMSVQKGCLTPYMRRRVFDWMIEVADTRLRLTNQALQLSFNYFDRFLSKTVCTKEKLQFVATACLWVASKCCSTDCPVATAVQLEKLVGCDQRAIVEMEMELLRCLEYEVMPVTSYDVIQLCLPFLNVPNDSNRKKLTQYVENISLAQAIAHPLLDFGAVTLAVTSIVCGMKLMTGVMDEDLNERLSHLAGTSPELTRICRRHTEANINLDQLAFGTDSVES